jgi:uncharacterized protein (DUF305 family)
VNKGCDTPALPYALEAPDAFDRACGSYGVSEYNTSNTMCPDSDYICASESYTPPAVEHFGACLEAVDCKMHVEMQTASDSTSPATTFMRQMIPHHENAVNMAKLLLKQGSDYGLECGDAEDDIDCDMTTALWEMINGQNAQITLMRNWLVEKAKPRHSKCPSADSSLVGADKSDNATTPQLSDDDDDDDDDDDAWKAVAIVFIVVTLVVVLILVATLTSSRQRSAGADTGKPFIVNSAV